ncbi:MAG: hypothetical protein D6826_02035 [Alphaproteobacteria bacterium]|nr:MAG: hypothetical protein D6826_02035 [Alphaproteobacteria bacterium]
MSMAGLPSASPLSVPALPPDAVAALGHGAVPGRVSPVEPPAPAPGTRDRRAAHSAVRPGPDLSDEERSARARRGGRNGTASGLPLPAGLHAHQRPGFGPGASAAFLAQAFAQDLDRDASPDAGRSADLDGPTGRSVSALLLAEHRDGPGLGAAAYRRAGAHPPLYSEQPTVFRMSI